MRSLTMAGCLVLGMLGISGAASAGEVRIGFAVPENVNNAPIYAAEKLGYFKEAGIDIKLIIFRGGAAAQEAMTAGQVDIIDYFGPAVGLAVSKGAKEKMVATAAASNYGWNVIVKKDSPIKSLKDLDGKKIGISTKASTSDMAALWLAEKAGIKMQQVPVGAGALIPSLRSGQVDAIAFSSLITQREIMTGNARLLMSIGDQMEPTLSDVYTASQKMIDERPQELRATLAAISKGLAHMRSNREWALAFLKEFAKADNDELNKLLYDDVVPKLSVDGKIERKWVEDGLKLAARAWDMPELGKVDPDSLFTNDFIPTVK